MSLMAGTWLGLALALVQAPSGEEIACVLATVSEADRALIASSMATGEIEPGALRRTSEGATTCADRLGSDASRIPIITVASLATIGRDRARGVLSEHGVDTQALDRWFAGQDEDFRTDPEMDAARGDRVARELRDAGIPEAALDAHAEIVGQYLGTMMVLERLRLGLPFE